MNKKVLKKLYSTLPYKKVVFLFLKKYFHLPRKYYQHLHFNDVFEIRIDEEKSFKAQHFGAKVENEIFWTGLYGSWEKESLKLWSYLCKTSRFIFDVGANTGIYSLIAQTMNQEANIYAFEPVERVFKR